jgi:DNA-binding transcriptional regulator YiaG
VDAVTFRDYFHVTLSVHHTSASKTEYPNNPRTLNAHIRKRRMDLNLFQREAAQVIGVKECTVYNWERGIPPATRHMPNILKFLGYNPLVCNDSTLERLSYYKRTNGLNYKDLGKLMKRDPEQLMDWVSGRRKPSRKNILYIEEFLTNLTTF